MQNKKNYMLNELIETLKSEKPKSMENLYFLTGKERIKNLHCAPLTYEKGKAEPSNTSVIYL